MRQRALRRTVSALLPLFAIAATLTGCGGSGHAHHASAPASTGRSTTAAGGHTTRSADHAAGAGGSGGQLDFPVIATKNTTRVAGNAIENAAAVALAVYPSSIPGTHPGSVVLAPTGEWQAAIAAASLMASPIDAPLLLSGPGSMPAATRAALRQLAPTGERAVAGAQLLRIGDVPSPSGLHTTHIGGANPYALAAAIDRFEARARGSESSDVVIASADAPAYAMPAAGWAAESGDPILYVSASAVPAATAQALRAHRHPHIYVLGPTSVIPNSILAKLRAYGTVKRISGSDPAASSVAFAAYRDPPCPSGQPCGHIAHSFGWAIRSPGHGYVLINAADPLDAAAAAPLSASGDYGPQLLVQNPNTLPKSVLNYFLNYATPGYTSQGPTAAVYNHGWLIGPTSAISVRVQAQVDSLLEPVPER